MEGVNYDAANITPAMARILTAAAREEGLTQPELAAATGISPRTIQRLLSGESKVNVDHLALIAEAVKKDPQELFRRAIERAAQAPSEPVSDAASTTDDVAERRRLKQEQAAGMTTEELEGLPSAAVDDAELDTDEPDPV
jgi:transcriptional regulator with XRE-family HTH domain